MKKIEYRQYYYEGYKDEVLEVPDDCLIYCTDLCGLYYEAYDNIWTKTYILLSKTEFSDACLQLGNLYFYIIYKAHITNDIEFSDFDNAPEFKNVYLLESNSITKLRKIIPEGIEIAEVTDYSNNLYSVRLSIIYYSDMYTTIYNSKIVCTKEISNKFYNLVNKIYKRIYEV